MFLLDRILQKWRILKAKDFLRRGMRVLDIGCGDGELFARLSWLAQDSIGIEPTLNQPSQRQAFRLLPGSFPTNMPENAGLFDAITMLAVLEHFPESGHAELGPGCRRYLKPGGLIVITVPSPAVDRILVVLKKLNLVQAASLDEHHEYDVRKTRQIFAPGDYDLLVHKKFQLGLNNLFVFRRPITALRS
jgi:SAM-dependent methyltransferase